MSLENSKSFLVTPASRSDAPQIARMNAQMAQETEGKVLEPETLARGVQALLEDPSKGFYWLARDADGTVVGQLMVTFEWSDWRAASFYWIQSVYVAKSARRRGVYRALYAALLAKARADDGVCGIRLYVEQQNQVAMATYASLGMGRAHYEMFEVDFVL